MIERRKLLKTSALFATGIILNTCTAGAAENLGNLERLRVAREEQSKTVIPMIPMPEVEGINIDKYVSSFGPRGIVIELPLFGKRFKFPSLVDGTVASINYREEDNVTLVRVAQQGDRWEWQFESKGKHLVLPQNKISMGQPIIEFDLRNLKKEDTDKMKYQGYLNPVIIFAYPPQKDVSMSKIDRKNILRDPRNPDKYLTIPTL